MFIRMLSTETKFKWIFENLLMPGMHTLSDAEVRGVRINEDGLKELAPRIELALKNAEEDLIDLVGHTFNPRSPIQVARIMFDELNMPEIQGRSTATTDVLLKLEGAHPFIDAMLNYRKLHTTQTRYVSGLEKNIRDGRVHTTFNLTGTKTGRLSSSNMNLQNITKKNKEIKGLFLPDEGCKFVRADQSQVELRMLAWLSDDPFLLDAFKTGIDLHGTMAQEVFGDNYTPEQRNLAKAFNFGLPFGRSVQGIMRDGRVKISEQDAKRISDMFFSRSPRVVEYMNETSREVRERGFVESPLGRRRRFANPTNDMYLWEAIARQAINMKPQSSASDITLHSINRLYSAGFDVRLTVHDDIVCVVREEEAEDAYNEMIKIMVQSGVDLYGDKVPFEASGEIGDSWGDV